MATVSVGLKELTGVIGRVCSESDHMTNMMGWFCMHPLTIMGCYDLGNQDYHHAKEDKILWMIEILDT